MRAVASPQMALLSAICRKVTLAVCPGGHISLRIRQLMMPASLAVNEPPPSSKTLQLALAYTVLRTLRTL